MKHIVHRNQQFYTGFSFIELILYVAIVSIVLLAVVPFTWNSIQSGVKSMVQQEVNGNARFVLERIKYEIRNASGINAVSTTSISLATTNVATNPTIIDLSAGKVRIKQGTGAVTNLNSANTNVNSLTFANFTSGDNKTKHVQISLTMAANFAAGRQEYQDSVTLESSAEVRSN